MRRFLLPSRKIESQVDVLVHYDIENNKAVSKIKRLCCL